MINCSKTDNNLHCNALLSFPRNCFPTRREDIHSVRKPISETKSVATSVVNVIRIEYLETCLSYH